ncbi:hypothetical protein GCM10022280_10880 [Sphingomonas swuensis]|uniref:Uncharacterized protein n=1 Tax=Sphingomonas swuensis TaxID=977800 RepID=A0ABP7SPU3_9SPHN
MAELGHWHTRCLTMTMANSSRLARLGRLFTIRTRWEAWAVTWAIALGAVERGRHYMEMYPGAIGWMFFVICTAVVFVAGAKLLDATAPQPELAVAGNGRANARLRRRALSRNRPRGSRPVPGSRSRPARRKD